MSGSCRNPKTEPIAQHNKMFHETLRSALIPPEALKQIEQLEKKIDSLEANLKAKDKALQYAQRLMEWAEKQCHTNCSSGYIPMMPFGDPELCEWCITKGLIEQALKGADELDTSKSK